MSRESTEEAVILFVASQVGVRPERVTAKTTLLGDLGVDGSDADDLLMEFMERFNVDMTGCRADEHFSSEGWPRWAPIYWLILTWRSFREKGSTPESCARLRAITVQDLVNSARAGKWSIRYGG